jgi:hypothetical protein
MPRSSEPGRQAATPTERPPSTAEVLAVLRQPPSRSGLFRGFGPLVVAVLLAIAMGLMVPSIAPEEIREQPRVVTVQPAAGPTESGQ